MESILSLEHISFYQKAPILKDISLSIEKNQILGLLGVNGAGKSTTLKICSGALIATSGNFKTCITNPAKELGFVTDTPPIIPRLTVKTYLKHIACLREVKKSQQQKACDDIIALAKLEHISDKTLITLSKGNLQRVNFAQALIHKPKLLLLDEPTTGLDPEQTVYFRNLLKSISETTSIIFSSHITSEISHLCNNAVIIDDGKTVKQIDIDAYKNLCLFEFYNQIDDSSFQIFPTWTKSEGQKHYFHFKEEQDKQDVINFCQEKGFLINQIIANNKQIESIFLNTITANDHNQLT